MATGRDLGKAYVSIVPDTEKFKPELEAALKKAVSGTDAKINVKADTSGVTAAVKKAKTDADATKATVKVDGDTTGLKDSVKKSKAQVIGDLKDLKDEARAMLADGIKFNIDATDTKAQAKIDRIKLGLTELAHMKVEADPEVSDVAVAKAQTKLSGLKASLDAFGREHAVAVAEIKTKTDNLGSEKAKVEGIGARLASYFKNAFSRGTDSGGGEGNGGGGIGGFLRNLFSSSGNGGNRAGSIGGNSFGKSFIKSIVMQNPGITAAVVALAPALPAALGAVGVLGGIALGAGIIVGAESLANKMRKTITTDLKQQTTLATKSSATPGQQAGAKQAAASDQQQLDQLNKQMAAFNKLNDAVKGLRNTFLNFAVAVSKPLLGPFTQAVNDLGRELNGPLKTAFTGLFKAVAPLVPPVLSMLLEIVEFALPGMTSMLNKARVPLTELMAGFGRIIGMKLGQWFQDAIPYMQKSVNYFLKFVSLLGSVGSGLIHFGGQLANVFGGPSLSGIGPLLSSIGSSIIKIIVPAIKGWLDVMGPVTRALLMIIAPILQFLAANPKLVSAITSTVAALMVMKKAMAGMEIVMGILDAESLPLTLAIGALALSALLIIKYWKPISHFFEGLWDGIKRAFDAAWGAIKHGVETAWHAVLDFLKHSPILAALGFPGLIAWVVVHWNTVVKVTKQAWNAVRGATSGAWHSIAGTMEGVGNGIAGFFRHVWGGMETAAIVTWNAIKKAAQLIWGGIWSVIKYPVLITVGLVGEAWIGIRNLTHMVWGPLKDFFVGVWHYMVRGAEVDIAVIRAVVVGGWHFIYNTTMAIWNPIRNFLIGTWNAISSHISAAATFIGSHVIGPAWHWVSNTTVAIWNPIKNFLIGTWNAISSHISAAVTFIGSHVIGPAWHWVSNLTVAIWNGIKGFFVGVWDFMVRGATIDLNVIKHTVSGAWNAVFGVTRTVFGGVENFFKGFWKRLKAGFVDVVAGIRGAWSAVSGAVRGPLVWMNDHIYHPFAAFVNKGLGVFGVKSKLPANLIQKAAGGMINGRGTGISDEVPAMLSHGEYVLKASTVRRIGKRNLDALNGYSGIDQGSTERPHFASGGQLVGDAERYRGHRYVWGGGANPATGWDCSSFMSFILGKNGGSLPGGFHAPSLQHGPTAAQFRAGSPKSLDKIKKGDIAVEKNGGHVGMVAANGTSAAQRVIQGFAAIGHAYGTNYQKFDTGSFDFYQNPDADNRGLLGKIWGGIKGAWGAVTSTLTNVAQEALSAVSGLIGKVVPGDKKTIPVQLAQGVISKILSAGQDAVNNNPDNWTTGTGGTTGIGGDPGFNAAAVGAAQKYAKSQLGRYGWGADQFGPLKLLWNKESGWNANAVNPTSGAYGIPQALGKGHPYNMGDYKAQVNWGLNYIKGRYGNPAGAWAHEQAQNWYSQGGLVGKGFFGGGTMHGTGIPSADKWNVNVSEGEKVLTRSQAQNYDKVDPTPQLLRTLISEVQAMKQYTAHTAKNTGDTAAGVTGRSPALRRVM